MAGRLQRVTTQRISVLERNHVVGRDPRCALRLDEAYVSAQHAAIYWTGAAWEVKDLGSRNGTFVNRQRLGAGANQRVKRGDVLSFGHDAQSWLVEDVGPPQVMAVAVGTDEVVTMEDDMLVLPTPESPQVTIFRARDGRWMLERAEETTRELQDQQTFEVTGKVWRFCRPDPVNETSTAIRLTELRRVQLRFGVSLDEEHVELRVELDGELRELGSRGHNYLLLTLARRRLEDAVSSLPDTSCGWIYQEELVTALGTTPPQLNVDIFRIRRQFASIGLADAANIIERRPRTGQLRIGVADLVVERL